MVRETQPLRRDLRNTAFWSATLTLLLAACLNPRPEELPSARGSDDGANLVPDNEIDVPTPAPAPASPEAPADNNNEGSSPATNNPEPGNDRDAGTATPPDAGAPDAGG